MVSKADKVRRCVLDDFDRAMLEFVVVWRPYGGPPQEEILPRFGLVPHEFLCRVEKTAVAALHLRPDLGEAVLCHQALAAASGQLRTIQ
jgi:hypothetical protein